MANPDIFSSSQCYLDNLKTFESEGTIKTIPSNLYLIQWCWQNAKNNIRLYMKEEYLQKNLEGCPVSKSWWNFKPLFFKSLMKSYFKPDEIYIDTKVILNIETNKNLTSEQTKHFKLWCLEFSIESAQPLLKDVFHRYCYERFLRCYP